MGTSDNARIELDNYELILKSARTFTCNNVIEIGSQNGWDAERLANTFDIKPSDVYIIEAHPGFYQFIKKHYPDYNVFNLAGSNKNGTVMFNAAKNLDDGRSSYLDRDIYHTDIFTGVEVESVRMDKFIEDNNIKDIDILKIDVEGATYEVLEGFGNTLDIVKTIQLEAELQPLWPDAILWNDIKSFLEKNNFTCFWTQDIIGVQIDSIWINDKYEM